MNQGKSKCFPFRSFHSLIIPQPKLFSKHYHKKHGSIESTDDNIGDGYSKLDGICECIESGNEFCGELQKEIEKLKEENMGLKYRLKST